MSNSLDSIRNFVALTPAIGTAGQPRADQFEAIAAAGYDTVINLAMPEHADSLDDEGRRVTALGMTYIHLPVPWDAPRPEQVRRFCDLLECHRERRVFVHCIMNYRVSAFMFLYRVHVLGEDPARARSPIFDRWQPEPAWRDLLELDAAALGLRPR